MDFVLAGYRVVVAEDGLVSMSECMADVVGADSFGWDSGPSVWHTWVCLGGLVDDVRAATDVVPGRHGLIQDVEQARLAARWLTASGLGDPKVFQWVAALLVEAAG